jgi:predicted DNA-binding transcriptional regulator AlpA
MDTNDSNPKPVISLHEAARIAGMHYQKYWRLSKSQGHPQPINPQSRSPIYRRKDIEEFLGI